MKRSIQTSKPGYTIGIEHDHRSIRAARLSSDGRGGFGVDRLEAVEGDFSEEMGLLDGFRRVKNALNIGSRDSVVACLAGKQVFATELPFRRLAAEEMEQALRLELRKTVHFEVATSTLDYDVLDGNGGSSGGPVQVMVALAANALLSRHLRLLEKAGLKAVAVDVLPVAVANALWAWNGAHEGDHPLVALHIGPQISTIVIDGEHSPFFNRSIHFSAEDVFAPGASPADRDKRIRSLADEVSRSLVFYEKNSMVSGYQEILLLGDWLDQDILVQKIQQIAGLRAHKMDLAGRMGSVREPAPGRFDLAMALALRGDV
jgi:Tfp pilus assembly PilM family ATPase